MSEEELCREIKSGAFSMQIADCERNIRIQFEQLQQENKQLKDKLIEINEVINGYMPNQYAMCKAFDEIEFIISKEENND